MFELTGLIATQEIADFYFGNVLVYNFTRLLVYNFFREFILKIMRCHISPHYQRMKHCLSMAAILQLIDRIHIIRLL